MTTRCLVCAGLNGAHGLIHKRHPAGGGGSNVPCPNTPSPDCKGFEWDRWSDVIIREQACTRCGRRESEHQH